jgi:hypothetical protein
MPGCVAGAVTYHAIGRSQGHIAEPDVFVVGQAGSPKRISGVLGPVGPFVRLG